MPLSVQMISAFEDLDVLGGSRYPEGWIKPKKAVGEERNVPASNNMGCDGK